MQRFQLDLVPAAADMVNDPEGVYVLYADHQATLDEAIKKAVMWCKWYKEERECFHRFTMMTSEDIEEDMSYTESKNFLASPLVTDWRTRQRQTSRRSCNRHDDCDKADAEGRTIHCSADDCEDCFGQ